MNVYDDMHVYAGCYLHGPGLVGGESRLGLEAPGTGPLRAGGEGKGGKGIYGPLILDQAWTMLIATCI